MKKLLTAMVFLLASSSAFAGIITLEDEFGIQGSTTEITIGKLNQTLSVAGFDATLGTLTSVSINVFGQIDSTASVTNLAELAGIGEVNIRLFQAWAVSTEFASDYTFATFGAIVLSGVSPNTLAKDESFDFGLSSTGVKSASLTILDLSGFISSDPITFDFTAEASTNISVNTGSGTGSSSNFFETATWGKVVVSYSYDDTVTNIPEPTSIALLSLGLLGFGLRKKK